MTVVQIPERRGLLRRRPRPERGAFAWDRTSWRRWSGRRWAKPVFSLQPELLVREAGPDTWPRLPQDRLDRLDRGLALAVERQVGENAARVDHEGPHGVVLAYQRPVSHLLHALLTLLTGGLWGVVWIVVAVNRRYDRVRLEMDPYGHVWAVPLPPRG
ncbi:hypothetical protein [Nocardioides aquiterrae]|uniref:Uncharacterized protein n=1 Tax=Nocardioides aquiterrae TaxID=203799 RepID=A0ABN1UEF2_9ACTN